MRITESPLRLIDFFLLDVQYQYIAPEGENPEADTIVFEEYDVDLDYIYRPELNAKDEIWVYARTAINCGSEPSAGYKLFVEGTGHFKASPQEGMTDENWALLLNQSALGIVINNLRSAIMQLTAHGPFGKYVLPSVDLADLHQRKLEALQGGVSPKESREN